MAKVLVVTADLPFFPGKMGLDFFNIRHLARSHHVGIVAPLHSWFPAESVANLEISVHATYLWPRTAAYPSLARFPALQGYVPEWIDRLPCTWLDKLDRRLLGLRGQPLEAWETLAMLANCAPQLHAAFREKKWHAIVFIQSSLAPILDYLPAGPAKASYFHDVRSDYLANAPDRNTSESTLRGIRKQEQRALDECDVVGFVSELDLDRALNAFAIRAQTAVCPIAIDTDYYRPRPPDWHRVHEGPTVLFTGHLSHPPNVDAVCWFLRHIWPLVLGRIPTARICIVGMLPAEPVQLACRHATNCELHPNVPDIRPYFWDADVFVVPMRYGGGVRQKLFEAWAMRTPVVCTTMAAEGSCAADRETALFGDTPEAFAQHICSLLQEPSRALTITNTAQTTLESTHSIPAASSRFREFVERTIRIKRSRPFRLLFDLRWMEIGRAGGTEQMSYELVDAISRIDHTNQYRILCPRATRSEWNFPSGFKPRFFDADQHAADAETLGAAVANHLSRRLGRHDFLTPPMRALRWHKRMDFDLVHSLCCYIHPDLENYPHVLTMLDIQHVTHPEFFTPAAWDERERLYRDSCGKAAHIIAISEFTRQDIHTKYGVPLDRISTVWIIPSHHAYEKPSASESRSLLASMGISGRYMLFPAHCWPHKNHARLVEAFDLVRSKLPPDVQLVLTGGAFPADHPAARLIRERELGGRIRHLGFRSPRELRVLLHNALALVFPSLFEGFGMPVAEAIIAGRPVLCSNLTSLPEIAGDAALYCNPLDTADIGARMVEICTSDSLRRQLEEAAALRRTVFSARKAAVQTLATYRRVYDAVLDR
jgi:glycosyltransferase involved in cell wall biosynthesis